jgi:hypothetical protein
MKLLSSGMVSLAAFLLRAYISEKKGAAAGRPD